MSWQPIETAPKDKVILLCNAKNIRAAWWEKEGWTVANTKRVVALMADPTHWMPLPPLSNSEEPDCPICGDYHEPDAVPFTCETGDGE